MKGADACPFGSVWTAGFESVNLCPHLGQNSIFLPDSTISALQLGQCLVIVSGIVMVGVKVIISGSNLYICLYISKKTVPISTYPASEMRKIQVSRSKIDNSGVNVPSVTLTEMA
jgi:hypothetical protein